eukprot:1543262-Alexandrium_andersonii.AAC.1
MAPPISFVAKAEGGIACTCQELDSEMHRAWEPIFIGSGPVLEVAARCVAIHGQRMVSLPTADIKPLTDREVWLAFKHGPANAGGPDGWQPGELRFLPFCAAGPLAEMLRCIEGGSPWPTQLTLG